MSLDIVHISAEKGRGAVARHALKAGTVIDVAHVLLIPPDEWEKVKQTSLYDFAFEWSGEGTGITHALAMGPGEFINHSYEPNARYNMDYERKLITFTTIKDIAG
ncbi:MAG: SET domain-containing protein-lysine N-methyltransferase, partial [Candidatus Lokiarchaeota archaeon]|nr:SET domain-containing protein-lysine N-methyltransferase [Candidatus Lokiarchaeota archaeon]